jgi:hypothetical protein
MIRDEPVIFYFLFNEPSKFEIHRGIRIWRAIAFDDSLAPLCEDRGLSERVFRDLRAARRSELTAARWKASS